MHDLVLFGAWCVERLNTWQTLVTGVAAVVAAGWTIRQTGAQHRGELRRKGVAARATLAAVLSDICGWAQSAANQIAEVRAKADGEGSIDWPARQDVHLERTSQDNIASLQRVLESTDEPSVVDRIWKMLGRMQVLATRARGLADRGLLINETDLNGYILEAGVVYAQASSLFRYARREDERAEDVSWKDVSTALHVFGLYTGADDPLYAQIDRFAAANVDPEK